METYQLSKWTHQIPREADLLNGSLRWVDVGDGARLMPIGRNIFFLSWLDSNYLSKDLIYKLKKGSGQSEERIVAKGIKKGARLLKQALSGKTSQIVLAIDFDILRDISLNGEMDIFINLLRDEPWKYILFTQTPYQEHLAEIIESLDRPILKGKIEMFFTGFHQNLDRVLAPVFKRQRIILDEDELEHIYDRQNILNMAKTVSVFHRLARLKVNFLIDIPPDDTKGGSILKQSFSSLITRSFLRAKVDSSVDIFFIDEVSKNKYPQLVLWLKERGHNIRVLLD